MRGVFLPSSLGDDPPAWHVAEVVARALTQICGAEATPVGCCVILPVPPSGRPSGGCAEIADALNAEQVVQALLLPSGSSTSDGRVALVIGSGYGRVEQRQIVLAVAKVWHGLCEVHTSLINAVEAASCPLPPRLAAWPSALEGVVLKFLGAAANWEQAGTPYCAGLAEALESLAEVTAPRF